MIRLDGINNVSELWNSETSDWSSFGTDAGCGFFVGCLGESLWDYFDVIVSSRWPKSFILRNDREAHVLDSDSWSLDIDSLLYKLFSEGFILRNELTREGIKEKVLRCESMFPSYDEISGKENERVFALIEEHEGFRVSLIITPFKRDIKVSLTVHEEKGVRTFAESYFHFEFDPWGAFNRIMKRDELNFMEQQGWPQYPEAYNNKQFFEILFNVNQLFIQPDYKVGLISSRRQQKFLMKYLKTLGMVYGKDIFNSHEKDINIRDEDIEVQFLKGRRIYTLPHFDLVVTFKPIEVEGYVRADIPIGGVSINYLPRLITKPPVNGYYLHPIVYEAGK